MLWVGWIASALFGLALVVGLVFGAASMAFGANGGNFILGQNNAATALTRLAGNVPGGPALQVINNKTDAGSRGLQVNVAQDKAPILVNSTAGKATNLNADKLDGKDSGEFVQNTGEMTFSVFDSWVSSHSPSAPVTVDPRGYWTTFARGAGGQTQSEVRLAPPLPSSLYGKNMLLTGMEICYDTSNPAVVPSRVQLLRYSSTNGGGAGGNAVVDDSTPTDGNQCRTYRGTPQLMGTNSFAFLEMNVNWSETTSQTTFSIQRTTFFLEPSNTAAAPLG
jgi:hypothetical protein